ncbi:MAG: T9SS type A sorting domain-containing protein, partial [Bacteroidetes bacterium]|nr:T9SS type A sorting domain-containing protein [Bacteroidota bacterium]
VGVSSQTYIVKQDICGNIKYDTVAVYASAVGMVSLSGVEDWGVNVYPNPAKDLLYVEVSHASTPLSVTSETSTTCLGGRQALSVTNALGQLIIEEELVQNKKEIDISKLPNGVYFLKVKNKNGIEINRKFIIEH